MSDLGIISSYVFLPLVIFGLLRLIQNENNWLEFSIGISLTLLSHILNFIIVIIFAFVFIIINIDKINKSFIKSLFKVSVLSILITSVFWIPFLHLYINNLGNINIPGFGVLSRIDIKTFMSALYGSKTINSIGFFPIISLFIAPFFKKYFNKYINQIYLLSVMIVALALFLPWQHITSYRIFNLLNQFQFTYRFLFIPQIILSFIFALIITQYIKSHDKRMLLCLSSILIAIVIQIFTGQYTIINKFSANPSVKDYIQKNGKFIDIHKIVNYRINNTDQFNLLLNTYYSPDDDYILKSSISMSPYVNRNLGFYNDYNKIKVSRIGYNTLSFSGNDNINKLSLPIYVYNKEKLHVYLNDRLVNNYVNKNGLLTIDNIYNDVKSNNKIFIKTSSDPFRITGVILSAFGWVIALIVLIKRKFFKFLNIK